MEEFVIFKKGDDFKAIYPKNYEEFGDLMDKGYKSISRESANSAHIAIQQAKQKIEEQNQEQRQEQEQSQEQRQGQEQNQEQNNENDTSKPNTTNNPPTRYKMVRFTSIILQLMGWFSIIIGFTYLFSTLNAFSEDAFGYLGALTLISILPSFGTIFSGLIVIMLAQVAIAIVDMADNMREMRKEQIRYNKVN